LITPKNDQSAAELLANLPPKRQKGFTRKRIVKWTTEEVPCPLFMKEAHDFFVKSAFTNRKTISERKKRKGNRIWWLIQAWNIVQSKPETKKLFKIDIQKTTPNHRTLNRIQSWALKCKNSESLASSPLMITIDRCLEAYGYLPITPRLKSQLSVYFESCHKDKSRLIGLEAVGKAFYIQKSAYAYWRQLQEPESNKLWLQESHVGNFFDTMDVLNLDAIKLKEG
jgi:hypothetical protein